MVSYQVWKRTRRSEDELEPWIRDLRKQIKLGQIRRGNKKQASKRGRIEVIKK